MRAFIFFIACLVCVSIVYFRPVQHFPNQPSQVSRDDEPSNQEIEFAVLAKDFSGSPLEEAMRGKRLKRIKAFLKAGATIRSKKSGGSHCPFNDIAFFDLEALELYLDRGFPPNGTRPAHPLLFDFIPKDDPRFIELLVRKGADPNGISAAIGGLLDATICARKYRSLKALLDSHANPNIQDRNGNTALHTAVFYNDKVAIQILVKAGANTHIKNKAGLTPLDVAGDIQGLLKSKDVKR